MLNLLPRPVYELLWQLKQRGLEWAESRQMCEVFSIVLERQLCELEVRCVIDVGANKGQFVRLLRRLGFRGKAISFEPVGENFEVLKRFAAADPAWDVYKIALGDTATRTTIHVTKSDDFSSILQPAENCEAVFGTQEADVCRVESVDMVRLGDILPNLVPRADWGHIHVKLDTQGFDLKVLQGLGELISEINSIQTELSVIGLYRDQPDYLEVLAFLSGHGFTPSCFFPVSRTGNRLNIVEFDGLFCRREV